MDVAASEFYGEKDQTYDLNFKEEVKSDWIPNFILMDQFMVNILLVAEQWWLPEDIWR